LRRACDRGGTHFDLANNYGPPYGSAAENFGRVMAADFAGHRDELIISTKAGWDMWPGPYGDVGGSRKYLIASCDQSLKRMGLDYVDIFYSHRVDPKTPLEETMGALAQLHRQGKALYVGISSYSPELTRQAAAILAEHKVPLLIHQPSYSMLNRWIEGELLDTLGELGSGCIAFSPLAQGMLSSKYLHGVPADARAARGGSLNQRLLSDENIERIRALHAIAQKRGRTRAGDRDRRDRNDSGLSRTALKVAGMTRFLLAAALLASTASVSGAHAQTDAARWKAEAARVTIARDDWGVAHIRGDTDADA